MPAPDLIASYWTISGDVYPGAPTEVSPFPFRDRCAAAAAAGFTGVGLVHQDIEAVKAEIGLPEMRRILDGHGLVHVEVEFLQHWWEDGERGAASAAVRRDLLDAAEALAARDIKIAPCYDGTEPVPVEVYAAAFAGLCAEAAERGTKVAIEPMPFTDVPTLERALPIVEQAGAANGGLLLDIWHVVRGGIPYAEVAAMPPGSIVSVEIDDADAEVQGSLWDDTIHHRRRCGEGALDIPGFVAAVRAAGWDGPYGVEVISTEHRALPLEEAARRGYDTTIAQLRGLR